MSAPVTLIFTAGSGPIGWLIRFLTKSKASHVMIGTELHGVPVVLHAHLSGVGIDVRERVLRKAKVVEEHRIKAIVDIQNATGKIGMDYDVLNLFGQAMVIMARWLRIKISTPFRNSRTFVCSEFVLQLSPGNEISDWADLDPELTTPQTLLDICQKSGTFERVA